MRAGTPPYTREAPAHFYRREKHYLITSGTTGYLPNPSEAAIADTWHGPYALLGNPHVGDKSNTSFHSQISSVFKVHGKKDLYIACADRWMPEYTGFNYEDYRRQVELMGDPEFVTDREKQEELSKISSKHLLEAVANANTSIADYVWLPIRFVDSNNEHPYGRVLIEWKDEWRIEDYE